MSDRVLGRVIRMTLYVLLFLAVLVPTILRRKRPGPVLSFLLIVVGLMFAVAAMERW